MPQHLLLALILSSASLAPSQDDTTAVPRGSPVPVRFLTAIESGKTHAGWTVEARAMADVVAGGCVVIPAYTRLLGIVDESLGGWLFRRRGRLHLTFEDANLGSDAWLPITAVVEDVEWLPARDVTPGGAMRGAQRSLGHTVLDDAVPFGGLTPLAPLSLPIGVASTALSLLRPGARVDIHAGDEATLRLTSAVALPPGAACRAAAPLPDSMAVPGVDLNQLPARPYGGNGQPGDVINILVEGSEDALIQAFTRADWVVASSGGLRSRVGAAGAVVLGKSYTHAPVSPQRLFDRVEDVAFERQGANARERHHVRMWALDSTRTIWVGAANEDVGVYVTVAKPRITHRMAPDLDGERDLLARELEGGACARRRGYTGIPRRPLRGRNSSGEEFATDGRAVVVRLEPCGVS